MHCCLLYSINKIQERNIFQTTKSQLFLLHLGIIFIFFSAFVPSWERQCSERHQQRSFSLLSLNSAQKLKVYSASRPKWRTIWRTVDPVKIHGPCFSNHCRNISKFISKRTPREYIRTLRSDRHSLSALTEALALMEAQTQGVQPGNEVLGLRSHASRAAIGTKLYSLKPKAQQAIDCNISRFPWQLPCL